MLLCTSEPPVLCRLREGRCACIALSALTLACPAGGILQSGERSRAA